MLKSGEGPKEPRTRQEYKDLLKAHKKPCFRVYPVSINKMTVSQQKKNRSRWCNPFTQPTETERIKKIRLRNDLEDTLDSQLS
mmetsp:Transcript_22772/g.40960  ORF Transcript_22772/g.40960 Transcript_22772/m.40960 type:complete len:83 (+) Transcript_22772:271-519(+)